MVRGLSTGESVCCGVAVAVGAEVWMGLLVGVGAGVLVAVEPEEQPLANTRSRMRRTRVCNLIIGGA
ncbi:MAG: hypothetical protein V3R87_04655 [Dehalococcoidia bacterium]